ncbi:MAG: glycosyltransferase family 4 protein [Promethearchaeota archaeon]
MRIVHVTSHFLPDVVGGVENYVYHLSKEFIKHGHNVTIYTSRSRRVTPTTKKFDGISVVRLPTLFQLYNTPILPSLFFELIKEDVDVIHAHLPHPMVYDMTAISSQFRNIPLVVTIHNLEVGGHSLNTLFSKFYSNTLLHLTLRSAKKIITTTQQYIETTDLLKKLRSKITVIPVGVDLKYLKIKYDKEKLRSELSLSDKFVILFVSKLTESHRYKGLIYLLKALAGIKKTVPEIQLFVIGKGKLRPYYEELTRKFHIEDKVTFTGFVKENTLINYYALADLLVLPSISKLEGFGMVALEALAFETPVITTDIAGVSEVLTKEKCGIVIESKNSLALTNAIQTFLLDRELARVMGMRGRKVIAQKYNWTDISKRMINVYQELID